jgi:hypothetical protein
MQPNLMVLFFESQKSKVQRGNVKRIVLSRKFGASSDGERLSDDGELSDRSHPVDAELWFGGKIPQGSNSRLDE